MTRSRQIITASVVLVAITIISVFLWRSRRAPNERAASRAPAATDAMAGMNMSPDGAVMLSASLLRQFGITFATVELRMLSDETRAAGTVVVDQSRQSMITARYSGYIDTLFANVEGQRILVGQKLAAIFSPELVAAQEELLVARQLDANSTRTAIPGVPDGNTVLTASSTRRLSALGMSSGQIATLLRTGRAQRTVTLTAPANGILTTRNVVQGQAVTAGMPLFAITDLSTVWIDVQLRASDASHVRVGSTAEISLTGQTRGSITGAVAYIYPTVDATSRTVTARVSLPNTDGRLKPGMFATVRLASPARQALAVPESAIITTGDGAVVFVELGGANGLPRLMPRHVELGTLAGGFAEVLAGLDSGQRVVTSAQYLLESESNLGEIMKSMVGMGASMPGMPGMSKAPGSGDSAGGDMSSMPGMAMPRKPVPATERRP